MPQHLLQQITRIAAPMALAAAAAAWVLRGPVWATALATGFAWIYVNFFFLFRLLETGLTPQPNAQKRILILAALKFPVIYLAGFFILQSRFFPTAGILAGLTVFFAALALTRLISRFYRTSSQGEMLAAKTLSIFGLFLTSPFGTTSGWAEAGHAAAHGAGEHAAEAAHHSAHAHPEVLSWVGLVARMLGDSPGAAAILKYEKVIFAAIIVSLISFFMIWVSKRRTEGVPSRAQAFVEMLVEGLDNFVQSVMGPRGRQYTPFLGSLFIYILVSNLFGLIPLQNSIMAYLTTVVPIAICVFLYVQWVGISKNGIPGYLHHLAGSPRDIFGWLLSPLMFPLHVMGEFIKPLSLSFRLYGNIMAGHVLLAVFMGLGIEMLKPLKIPAGIPIHFPFLFLELLVGVIQAFVFTLLSTIYISMMLPHEDHAEHVEHGTHTAH